MGKGCLAAAAAATVAANAGRRVVRQAGGVGAIGRPRCSGVPVYRATAAANAANAAAATATTTPSRWWPLQARVHLPRRLLTPAHGMGARQPERPRRGARHCKHTEAGGGGE